MVVEMAGGKVIVGIGEILWDIFPDGPQFGGAPANFASSVAGLAAGGAEVHVVSAVGRDELGTQALDLLRARDVQTSYVAQIERPTGQVFVRLDSDGRATYEFAADTAWDNLAWSDSLEALANRADAVCFGTLGQRSGTSRQTIHDFIRATRPDCLRILDINLRPPFWEKRTVLQSLELANVLKLNDDELIIVAELFGWNQPAIAIVERLLNDFSLQVVALTRGSWGAVIVNAAGERSDVAGQGVAVVNTVGAGDAFTAAVVIGLLNNLSLKTINEWANRVAAFVCTQPGAAPSTPAEFRLANLS